MVTVFTRPRITRQAPAEDTPDSYFNADDLVIAG